MLAETNQDVARFEVAVDKVTTMDVLQPTELEIEDVSNSLVMA
jgi:hypothetical protein